MDILTVGGVHMDKNVFSKSKNFFKREGFYVILFVCLCVVATVAAVTTRNAKKVKNNPISQPKATVQNAGTKVAEEPTVDYPNALQVKKNTDNKTVEVPKSGAAAVAKSVDNNFVQPVKGTVALKYSEDPVEMTSINKRITHMAMDIKANLGDSVVAVMDGKVESIETTEEGMTVTVYHASNGLRSIYANLDEKVKVTKGQSVKKGEQIGVVGNTTTTSAYEKYGSHLHFAMKNQKDFVDPAKYVKY